MEGASLTSRVAAQYGYFIRGMLKDMEEAFLLYRQGRPDDEFWKTRAALVLAYVGQAPARDIYRRDKALGMLYIDFVQCLDQPIQEQNGR